LNQYQQAKILSPEHINQS